MRATALPLQTARHALVAATVAAAVAVPAVVLGQRALDSRDAPASRAAGAGAGSGAAGPAAQAAARAASRPRPSLPGPGLPGSVAEALKHHPLVVVGLYAAGDTVDMSADAEAEAGAELAGVPYVAINVNDESQIGDLASRLPSLAVPSVALLGRGGRVVSELPGWIDRQAVAGAIDAARHP